MLFWSPVFRVKRNINKILIIKSNSIGEQNLYNFIFTSNDDVESIVNMIKEYILNQKLDVSIDFDNNEEVSNILVINHAKGENDRDLYHIYALIFLLFLAYKERRVYMNKVSTKVWIILWMLMII